MRRLRLARPVLRWRVRDPCLGLCQVVQREVQLPECMLAKAAQERPLSRDHDRHAGLVVEDVVEEELGVLPYIHG